MIARLRAWLRRSEQYHFDDSPFLVEQWRGVVGNEQMPRLRVLYPEADKARLSLNKPKTIEQWKRRYVA